MKNLTKQEKFRFFKLHLWNFTILTNNKMIMILRESALALVSGRLTFYRFNFHNFIILSNIVKIFEGETYFSQEYLFNKSL